MRTKTRSRQLPLQIVGSACLSDLNGSRLGSAQNTGNSLLPQGSRKILSQVRRRRNGCIVIALGYGAVAERVLARSMSPSDNAVGYWRGCMVLYCRPKASPRRCLIHQGCSQLSTNNQRREPSGSDLRGFRLDWPGAHRSSFHDMRTGSSVMCQERIASNFLCAVTQFIPADWPPSEPRRRTPRSSAHPRAVDRPRSEP